MDGEGEQEQEQVTVTLADTTSTDEQHVPPPIQTNVSKFYFLNPCALNYLVSK
jgi:hypothetical protein